MSHYASRRYTKESGIYLPVGAFISDAKIFVRSPVTSPKNRERERERESVKYHVFKKHCQLKNESVLEHEGCFQCYQTEDQFRAVIGLDNEAE